MSVTAAMAFAAEKAQAEQDRAALEVLLHELQLKEKAMDQDTKEKARHLEKLAAATRTERDHLATQIKVERAAAVQTEAKLGGAKKALDIKSKEHKSRTKGVR